MVEKQLSIFLENKPGVMAQVCATLAKENVDLRAISVSDTVDHSVVRLIVSEPRKAIHVLGDRGLLVVETDVLSIKLANQPGAWAQVARKLGRAQVNIEYAYGSGNGDEVVIFLRVSDLRKALKVLGTAGGRRKRKA